MFVEKNILYRVRIIPPEISTKYSWNLKYIQIIRYRKKYQLKALKTYKGHQPFYICCYNDHQKTIKPFFAKKYVNLGM